MMPFIVDEDFDPNVANPFSYFTLNALVKPTMLVLPAPAGTADQPSRVFVNRGAFEEQEKRDLEEQSR